MNIMVTGGLGFIGSNFVNLTPGVQSVVDKCTYAADQNNIEREDISFFRQDIAEVNWPYLLEQQRPDILVNFAAESHVDNSIVGSSEFLKSNVVGVQRILDGIRNYRQQTGQKVLLIHVCTDEVYGDVSVDSEYRFKESDKLIPNNPYSATKAAAYLLINAYHRTYNDFDFVVARACNNFGPNQHSEKFIPTIIGHVENGKPIPVYGDGKNVREWLYVADFVEGICSIIGMYQQSPRSVLGCTFNFGSSIHLDNLTLVHKILEIMRKTDHPVEFVSDRKGHDRKYAVDFSKAWQVLGWKAKTPFNVGLRKTIENLLKVSV
jgi:dTDP-glucose 4,6-dehydratase